MPTQITSADSGSFVDTQRLHLSDADSGRGHEFQDDSGDIELYSGDSAQFQEIGYAEFSVNPFQQMSFIQLSIAPYYEVSLQVLAHT